MDKTHYPRWFSALAMALCCFLAYREFETIKTDRKTDQASITSLTADIAMLRADIRVLLERSQYRLDTVIPQRKP